MLIADGLHARPRQLALDFGPPPGREIDEPDDLASYDHIIIAWSGGKDSAACLLHLLESGADRTKMELWHHDVDGREGSTLMDWPCTRGYCAAVGRALGIPVRFSWREGGFEREMLRKDAPTAKVLFEGEDGGIRTAGGNSKSLGTRLRFPQVSGDLTTRWCSSYMKCMLGIAALTNQDRFLGRRLLFITGERAQESAGRAKYRLFEPHKADTRRGTRRRRLIDHWRPVHSWTEEDVWAILARWRMVPHPCYRLGWSRASCAACIFGADVHWSSLRAALPEQFAAVAAHEASFDATIARDRRTIIQRADAARPFPLDPAVLAEARDPEWNRSVFLAPGEEWRLPVGAYGSPESGPC
ncbi:phosphoadenosine phosphosulfate reductase domain-containing protein [Magnetospirillum sp. ME-1]|uniref:phosphoadenosine phosphosulfate reductase domain-containing protein n=1 Tax=Magnetospirillum sp. ME-1 TaxID=1639348 RepID=UPI000A18EE86|nr:phosphoadenosine phosphosulfate reductase family protein [Magnetospirillum sp. ME-1]